MTKDEAIEALDAIPAGDREKAHILADDIVLDFLRDNGFVEIEAAWERVDARCGGFWYA